MNNNYVFVWFGLGLVLLAYIFVFPSLCLVSSDQAQRSLSGAGFVEIKLGGYSRTECGEDIFSREFQAKGPTGISVSGVVCQGLFKGTTIRLTD